MPETLSVLRADDVTFVWDGRAILTGIDIAIGAGERWALLGPNGTGKSTLLSLLGAREHPTSGTVEVLGNRMGRVDVRELRRSVGHVEPRHSPAGPLDLLDVVLTGATGTSGVVPYRAVTANELKRARELANALGVSGRIEDAWDHLSQGERTRTLIARALMPEPRLLLLDEPATGLDLAAREELLERLEKLAVSFPDLTTITVTHHLEELPRSTTHALLLRDGRVSASGPASTVLTSAYVSQCFGLSVSVDQHDNRWSARRAG